MSCLLPAINHGNLLCVTSPHEDEGYLSPSEEDLRKAYQNRPLGGYLDCNRSATAHCSTARSLLCSKEEDDAEGDAIPWEIIACTPHVRTEHLSWDRLKLPVPYRFHDEHRVCLRQVRQTSSVTYLTDSSEKHAEIVENIWRSYEHEPIHEAVRIKKKGQGQEGQGHQDASTDALKTLHSVKDKPIHISVQKFIEHIFHLLCGRESQSFYLVPGDKYSFAKNPMTLVEGMSPGLAACMSEQYLASGRIFKRLHHVSALHYDEKMMEREGLSSNAVFVSLLKFMSDYLKLYQTSLMLKAPSIHSFSRLNLFFKPFHYQLWTLERVLDLYITTDQVTLLKGLNTLMLSNETPFASDLLRSAFITCSAAYLRYVADWIFRGTLTKGFHIEKAKPSTYMDRRFWVKQFSQVTTSVPAFLEDTLDVIFETGKAINLLNIIRNTEPRSALLSCIMQDEGLLLNPALEFEAVTELENNWKIKVDAFFEEYSFLQTDLDALLVSAGTESQNKSLINFDAVEDAKQQFELKRSQTRQQLNDQKIEKQMWLRNMLDEQMAEKRDRKRQEKEDEILENERISADIAKADKRDLAEEMRLMKKHFGEQISETVGLRNVKQRIAATESGSLLEYQFGTIQNPEQTDGCQSTQSVLATFNARDEQSPTFQFPSDADESLEASWNTNSADPTSDMVGIRSRSNSIAKGDTEGRQVSNASPSINDPNECSDSEEKFNPDKLKTRAALPYDTSLDFDNFASALLPQPILKFSSCTCIGQENEATDINNKKLKHDSFFLNFSLNQSVFIPVMAQNRMVNSTLLHYFIVEKQLFYHVEALNRYLGLQNGLFGHFLSKSLIQEVKNGGIVSKEDIPRNIGRLNAILGEAVALSAEGADRNDIRDNLGFILVRQHNNRMSMDLDDQLSQKQVKSRSLVSPYEVLDEITLNYSVEWPLSILLTDDLLIHYEKLFTFLMRLYRAELVLLSISSIFKFKGSKSKQLVKLYQYRYKMLHFVRTVRHYINVTVIHCAWTELAASFHKMDSLDKLYEGLVRHIKFVTTNCLLGIKGESVKKLLLDQLVVIECFCEDVEKCGRNVNWDAGEEMHVKRFAKVEQKFRAWEEIQKVFNKVFFKLATRGTYQKISYFLQLFNFNGYFGNTLE